MRDEARHQNQVGRSVTNNLIRMLTRPLFAYYVACGARQCHPSQRDAEESTEPTPPADMNALIRAQRRQHVINNEPPEEDAGVKPIPNRGDASNFHL
jgi:hypothetical protein